MAPVLAYLISVVLMVLFILDYQMGAQDMALRLWPRPIPLWMRLLIAAFCITPLLCWMLYAAGQGMNYVAVFLIVVLLPAELVYGIFRRRYVRRQLRRQLVAMPTARAEG